MKKYIITAFFSFLFAINPAVAEVKTTVNPSDYTIQTITAIDNQIIQLQDGSTWRVELSDEEIDLIEGDKVELKYFNYPKRYMVTFKKINSSSSSSPVYATLIDLPFSDSHVIEKVQFVKWLGELQALVTLKDGSVWLFDEFSTHSTWYWKAQDQVLITKYNNYYMYNLDAQTQPGRIVQYTIENDYEIQTHSSASNPS